MKKNLLFAAAAGIMLFSACSNDEDVIIGGGENDVNASALPQTWPRGVGQSAIGKPKVPFLPVQPTT